jgi:uncharacterized protein YndB with AHSA1/START domain
MTRRLHHTRTVDLDFVHSAPVRLVFSADLAAPPEAVHDALAKDTEGWAEWFDAVTAAVPTAAGRDVSLKGGIRFQETVLAADAPTRYAYRADATNAPGLHALLEDWTLSPTPASGTHLQWTFAADGSPVLRAALRLARPGLGRAFRAAARALDRRTSGR